MPRALLNLLRGLPDSDLVRLAPVLAAEAQLDEDCGAILAALHWSAPRCPSCSGRLQDHPAAGCSVPHLHEEN